MKFNRENAASILQFMLDGIDPITGEILPEEHLCNYLDVQAALKLAVHVLTNSSSPVNKKNGKLNAGRSWSPEDLEQLKALYASGVSITEICAQLERRERGVRKQLEYLGLVSSDKPVAYASDRPVRVGQRWTLEEDNALLELFDKKQSVSEISSRMQRTQYSIFCRMEKLGLYGEEYGYPSNSGDLPWTNDEVRRIREMYLTGIPLSEIASKTGRTEKSIAVRLYYMGLIEKTPI